MLYEDIIEVVEGGQRWANWFLAYGYRLLDIQNGTRAALYPPDAKNAGQAYVRRGPVYVLGRPKDVGEAPRPPSPYPHRPTGPDLPAAESEA